MRASIFAPLLDGVRIVQARRAPGPPSFEVHGLAPDRAQAVSDRVRAGIANAGFALPTGRVEVTIGSATECATSPGLDLPIALAILLAEPSRRFMRRPGLVAWGAVKLDGTLAEPQAAPLGDLPDTPWVGRFWSPVDHVPSIDEPAVLSIVDVEDLETAWGCVFGLLMLEQHLAQQIPNMPAR